MTQKVNRGGIGTEYPCPEDKEDHSDCLRCGGFGTIWLHAGPDEGEEDE